MPHLPDPTPTGERACRRNDVHQAHTWSQLGDWWNCPGWPNKDTPFTQYPKPGDLEENLGKLEREIEAKIAELALRRVSDIPAEAKPDFLTVAEVASQLRVSKMTVYRMCERGDLPCVHITQRTFRIPARLFALWLEEKGYTAP